MSEAVELATEVVADVVEMAPDATIEALYDHIHLLTGSLKRAKTVYGVGGVVVGAVIGGGVGFYILRNRLEKKYEAIAQEEIATYREHYEAKIVAAEPKPDPADIIAENGYSTPKTSVSAPLAITPPDAVVDAAAEAREAEGEPDEVTPVTIGPTPQQDQEVRDSIRRNMHDDPFKWNWATERQQRSPKRPYVIHYDERTDEDAFPEVTWTYYAADDVLCNEKDEVIDRRDEKIGEDNLDRFGHGSHDDNIVYIRNQSLHMDIEVIKSENSYVEEVIGIKHSDVPHARRRPSRAYRDDD